MKESQFLIIMANLQIIIAVLSSGFIAGFFIVMALANCVTALYYMYKEDKEKDTVSVTVAPIVIEKEKV